MELELRDYIRILRKRKWWAILSLVVCLGTAGALTYRATPVYEAEAYLFVGQQQVATQQLAEGVQVTQLSQQLLETYAEILKRRPISERAVEEQDLPVSPTALAEDLQASPILDTQLINLAYRSTDPALARRTVNAVSRAFVAEIETLDVAPQSSGEPAVQVSVVEPALEPQAPVSPQPVRNMALAFVLGAMLGVGVAFLVEYLDTSLKDGEEIERLVGLSVLAAVPKFGDGEERPRLERDPQTAPAEAFRKLRTAMQFLAVEGEIRTVLVTSPVAREGKSTTALNLAHAYAQAGHNTLLLEADLRRPALHEVFSPEWGPSGFSGALSGQIGVDQAVVPTPIQGLSCMFAGPAPPNPVELLASSHAAELIEHLRSRFDRVVVDCTPSLPVADASALAPRCDGVLLVVRAGKTHRDGLTGAVEVLRTVGARPLGVVLNVLSPKDARYGYGYGVYRYYRADDTDWSEEQLRPPSTLTGVERPAAGGSPNGDRTSDPKEPRREASGKGRGHGRTSE